MAAGGGQNTEISIVSSVCVKVTLEICGGKQDLKSACEHTSQVISQKKYLLIRLHLFFVDIITIKTFLITANVMCGKVIHGTSYRTYFL